LVICKPVIRRVADVGDWIVGLGSAKSPIGDVSDCVVYAMKITKKMTMREYDQYCREHLPQKIPDWRGKDYKLRVGDCIYDYSQGDPPKMRLGVHNERNRARDLSGIYALLSSHFYYFGDKPFKLCESLRPIIHRTQGHKSTANQPYLDKFVTWVEGLGYRLNEPHGEPQLKSEFVRGSDADVRNKCARRDLDEAEEDIYIEEKVREQFFPMSLPSGVVGRWMDQDAAQEPIGAINHLIFPPGFKQALGLFVPEQGDFATPEARREGLERLQRLHARSQPEWIVFYDQEDAPIGWFYGYMEDEETFFIDTIGLLPAFRGRGIYTAFLKQLSVYLRTIGYERLATTHHPNNRAALIADLKAGFNIVGLELHESHGPMVKMACFLHDDRRRGFEQAFSAEPEPGSETKKS
jgi:RimJ/RimL family protein N-acetyltransferase